MNLTDQFTVRLIVFILAGTILIPLVAVCYLAVAGEGVDPKDLLALVTLVVGALLPSPLSKARQDGPVEVQAPPGQPVAVDPVGEA